MVNMKLVAIVVLVAIVFVAGCTSNQGSGYATYNNPNSQQQQYVGGGCGVAADTGYENVYAVSQEDSSL